MPSLVSVVIPTIGRPSLETAIGSVLDQGVDVEVVVVDDSGAGAVSADLGDQVRVVRTSGRTGAAAARNVGMAECRGEFFAFLDDDDVWMPGHLADALDVLGRRPEVDVYASRGLVLDETGSGRVEPAVLVGDRTVAEYFFGRGAWRSRNRRILTPTLVARSTLRDHPMESGRAVNEDTWWLLTAERDRGARLVQSPHVGVVVHGSSDRNEGRWREDLGDWLDRVEELQPGAAATEQLAMFGRPAVRAGRPETLVPVARDILRRPRGWTWAPVLAAHMAAAGAVALRRRR